MEHIRTLQPCILANVESRNQINIQGYFDATKEELESSHTSNEMQRTPTASNGRKRTVTDETAYDLTASDHHTKKQVIPRFPLAFDTVDTVHQVNLLLRSSRCAKPSIYYSTYIGKETLSTLSAFIALGLSDKRLLFKFHL